MDTIFQQPAAMIEKSQLRRLAHQFYVGEIDQADYRRRRCNLIDGIVDGDIAIERESPAPAPAPVSTEPPPLTPEPAPVRSRISPVHAGVGVMVMAAVGWALWPGDGGDAPPAPATVVDSRAPGEPRLPTRTIPEARTLVESFLATRDWSDGAISKFERRWEALAAAERDGARSSPWFRRLTKSVRDELKTQKALAEFDKTGSAKAAAERLAELRERLGGPPAAGPAPANPSDEVSRRIPAPSTSPPVAPVTPVTQPAPAAGPGVAAAVQSAPTVLAATAPPAAAAPAATVPAATPPRTAATVPAAPAATPVPRTRGQASGNAWLDAQPGDGFTLQLFALNHLDRIERLMSAHPGIAFRVIAAEGSPRYRVLLGTYPTEAQARAAHARLPETVRGDRPTPLIRRFSELRGPPKAPAAGTPASSDWLDRAGREKFTLQLFASSRRDSVDQLIARNPELDLRVVHTRSGRPLYRVVHGVYADAATATSATAALPADLLRDTGKPLVKSIAELQDARAR